MSLLRRFRFVFLTADERTLLEAPRDTVLRAMLLPEELRILEAVETARRFAADPEVSKEDAEAWEKALRTPVGLKADTAMINWLHQQAQAALMERPDALVAQAKFALGCRAGWEMGKSILRLVAAKSDASEDAADTAAATLDHLKP
jgi:hypothetical protein